MRCLSLSEMIQSFACGQGKSGLLASSLVVQEVMVCCESKADFAA